jgi:hypothetical protein
VTFVHQLRHHKVLRRNGKLLNMLSVRGCKVCPADVAKESLSHADDSEEEEEGADEEEVDVEGRGEAESREEDEKGEKIT